MLKQLIENPEFFFNLVFSGESHKEIMKKYGLSNPRLAGSVNSDFDEMGFLIAIVDPSTESTLKDLESCADELSRLHLDVFSSDYVKLLLITEGMYNTYGSDGVMDSIERIERLVASTTREQFLNDERLQDAAEVNLIRLCKGRGDGNIDDYYRLIAGEVYIKIDARILWNTLVSEIPKIKDSILNNRLLTPEYERLRVERAEKRRQSRNSTLN